MTVTSAAALREQQRQAAEAQLQAQYQRAQAQIAAEEAKTKAQVSGQARAVQSQLEQQRATALGQVGTEAQRVERLAQIPGYAEAFPHARAKKYSVAALRSIYKQVREQSAKIQTAVNKAVKAIESWGEQAQSDIEAQKQQAQKQIDQAINNLNTTANKLTQIPDIPKSDISVDIARWLSTVTGLPYQYCLDSVESFPELYDTEKKIKKMAEHALGVLGASAHKLTSCAIANLSYRMASETGLSQQLWLSTIAHTPTDFDSRNKVNIWLQNYQSATQKTLPSGQVILYLPPEVVSSYPHFWLSPPTATPLLDDLTPITKSNEDLAKEIVSRTGLGYADVLASIQDFPGRYMTRGQVDAIVKHAIEVTWTAGELMHGKVTAGLYIPGPYGVKGGGVYIPPSEGVVAKAYSEQQDALAVLNSYKLEGGTYDVVKAVSDDIPASILRAAGFAEQSIKDAQSYMLGHIRGADGKYLTNDDYNKLTDWQQRAFKEKGYDYMMEVWPLGQPPPLAQQIASELTALTVGRAQAVVQIPTGISQVAASLYQKIDDLPSTTSAKKVDAVMEQIGRGGLTGIVDLTAGTLAFPMVALASIAHLSLLQPKEAGQDWVQLGEGIPQYLSALKQDILANPAYGVPRAMIALFPMIVEGAKIAGKVAKAGAVAGAPHGVPARAMTIEAHVAGIPIEGIGLDAGLELMGRAIKEELAKPIGDKTLTGEVRVSFPDTTIEKAALCSTLDVFQKADPPTFRLFDLTDAQNIPRGLAKKMQDLLVKAQAKVGGSFVDWLHMQDAAQPHDIDAVFKDKLQATEATREIIQMAKDEGLQAKEVPHGVAILSQGEWIKIIDINTIEGHDAMLSEGMKPIAAKIVDTASGEKIPVERLGDQFRRLSRAVLTEEVKGKAIQGTKYYSRIETVGQFIAKYLGDPDLYSKMSGEAVLKYRRAPLQTVERFLVHATPDGTDILNDLKTKGYFDVKGTLYTSPKAAMDFLARSAHYTAPKDPMLLFIRIKDLEGFKAVSKSFGERIEAEEVAVDSLRIYTTEPNIFSKMFGGGTTAETFTEYKGLSRMAGGYSIKSGQLVPCYWLRTADAPSGAPSIGSLYAATGMALVETLKDIPYWRLNKIKFELNFFKYGGTPFRSIREAYTAMAEVTSDLETKVMENAKGIIKGQEGSVSLLAPDLEKISAAVRDGLDKLSTEEIQRILRDPNVQAAIRSNEKRFEEAYSVNLAKYLNIASMGTVGAIPDKPVSESPADVISTYGFRDGELTSISSARTPATPTPTTPTTPTPTTPTPAPTTPTPTPTTPTPPTPTTPTPTIITTITPPTPPSPHIPSPRIVPPVTTVPRRELREKEKLEDIVKRLPSEGVYSWKQGFIYKTIYPPYGRNDIVNTKQPLPGVPVLKGPQSAYRSIIASKGAVPEVLKRDMGIMDLVIETKPGGRPVIKFKKARKKGDIPPKRSEATGVARVVGV